MSKKVVVIGWDGATFKVLDSLLKKGLMPNLAKLKKEGAHGKLESVLPTLTLTAWATFATGKNPGHHGCYDWFKNEGSLKRRELITSADIKGETFYEALERLDKRSVLINLPLSFPPRIKKGTMVSSFLAGEGFSVHPSDLQEKIEEFKDYRPFFKAYEEYRDEEEFISDVRAIAKSRFLLAKRLFKEDWDLFFCLFSASDWVQHKIPGVLKGQLESSVLALFQELDGYLGYFMENLPKEGVLFLISDHGFKIYKGEFLINSWLEKEGYLIQRVGDNPSERQRFRAAAKDFPGIFRWGYSLLGRSAPLYVLVGLLARVISRFLPHRFLGRLGGLGLEMDPPRTAAYSPPGTSGEIYLNRRGVFEDGSLDGGQAEEVKKEIAGKLRQLKDPLTQGRTFQNVYTKEELYGKDCLADCPDMILESSDFIVSSDFGRDCFISQEVPNHDREGILFAFDPGIKKRAKVRGARLEDLGPTILHLLEAPLSEEMDGIVLKLW